MLFEGGGGVSLRNTVNGMLLVTAGVWSCVHNIAAIVFPPRSVNKTAGIVSQLLKCPCWFDVWSFSLVFLMGFGAGVVGDPNSEQCKA